ncbi:MAG TPA: hypothetical protein ENK96_07920 [Desulfobulbaceae bacterium]|nr:hypothetical protein [Desulfobulbaceae bacterium]
MRKLLHEISVIPGVTGSCIFDKKEGLLCSDLHSGLSKKRLQIVGIHLVRLMQMGTMAGLSITSSHFRFDKYTVIGIPLDIDAVLLTLCDAQANCSLVATSAVMLATDMREELDRGISATEETGNENKIIADDNGDETFIQLLYDEIEQALAGAIGPVAGVVMQDYLVKWKQRGPATPDRLPELAQMLEQEIGKIELAREFSEKIKALL